MSQAHSRRIKVKGRRSIYYRTDARGRRRYEFTYRDSDGRQRWQVVPGCLEEAQAARDEVCGKLRRGERVAPSRLTFEDVAPTWLATQSELRPRTRAAYESALRVHLVPCFGRRRLSEINEDDIALFIASMRERGYAAWSIRATLTPLGRVFDYAARRGMVAGNPIKRLERGERPAVARSDMRILAREEIDALLGACEEDYRPLLATAIFTGLRLGELLGLTWANVDLDAGVVRVRRQLDRKGQRVEPKTPQAVRDVVMLPALSRILREHRLRSRFAQDHDFVFPSRAGAGLDHTVPRRALKRSLQAAQLDGGDRGHLRFHGLRHVAASLLIASGGNVVWVSRQLGHGKPDITLRLYSHLFDGAEHAERMRATLEASFGSLLDGNSVVTGARNGTQEEGAETAGTVLPMRVPAATGN